jgi:two-component system, OmpR family, phosphate regulon sensor histidine kinase PhoR
MKTKPNIGLSLIPISILLLIGLNAFWLFKTFQEHKTNLQKDIEVNFDKTITVLNDSSIQKQITQIVELQKTKEVKIPKPKKKIIHHPEFTLNSIKPADISRIVISPKNDYTDTLWTTSKDIKGDTSKKKVSIFISVNSKTNLDELDSTRKSLIANMISKVGQSIDNPSKIILKMDSFATFSKVPRKIELREVQPRIIDLRIDSLKTIKRNKPQNQQIEIKFSTNPLPMNAINHRMNQFLKQNKILIPYKTFLSDSTYKKPQNVLYDCVATGFNGKMYNIEFSNYNGFLLKKMLTEIFFSVFLIAITILSFALIYRNLQQQKRLTILKNDFISNVTHELKTPITTVGVAIEALSNFNVLQNPNQTKEYLDISKNELNRLSLMVDKVLKMAIFEQKDLDFNFEPHNLKEIIEKVLLTMKLQFEKYKAQVHFEAQGENFTLNCDAVHLTNVVFNLIENALKYAQNEPTISINLKNQEGIFTLSIKDNGIGIPKEFQHKIFDKFFRVPTGDVHNIKGYGLGLSYVKSVIDKHNGKIEIVSEEGVGSEFKISFLSDKRSNN